MPGAPGSPCSPGSPVGPVGPSGPCAPAGPTSDSHSSGFCATHRLNTNGETDVSHHTAPVWGATGALSENTMVLVVSAMCVLRDRDPGRFGVQQFGDHHDLIAAEIGRAHV